MTLLIICLATAVVMVTLAVLIVMLWDRQDARATQRNRGLHGYHARCEEEDEEQVRQDRRLASRFADRLRRSNNHHRGS